MDAKVSDTESNLLNHPRGIPHSYMNGVSDLIIKKESDRNIPENLFTRTVENVMLDMEKEENSKQGSTDSHSQHLDLPNHASQLLKAAASAVSNSFRGDTQSQLQQNGQGDATELTKSHENDERFTDDTPLSTNYSGKQQDLSSANQVTTVSFTSKPTMSTGFTSSSASLPAPGSLGESTTLTESGISAKREPMASQVVVPFLWRRCMEEGRISYYSPSDVKLTSLEETKKYLLEEETCKCGLQCPFHVEKVFNFDPEIPSRPWKITDTDTLSEPVSMACCHRKHIRSHAMSLECKSVNNKVTKTTPIKRKGKTARKSASSKSTGSSKSAPTKGGSDGVDASQAHQFTPPKPPVQPLPSVETVASQLRNARSLEVTPPQMLSPNHINSGLSPRLLSPTHDQLMGTGYGLPPAPPSMMPSPQNYPANPMMHYPMTRHPTDPAMMMSGHPSGYYPAQSMPSGYLNPFVHSFSNQPPYDHLSPRPPTWPTTHPMIPPSTAPPSLPMWQPRPGLSTPSGQKRKRRPSSKSSNGGLSDTSFNSGLGSPSLKSPGSAKVSEKKGISPEAQNSHESAISTNKADNSDEVDHAVKSEIRSPNYSDSMPGIDSIRMSRPSVIQGPVSAAAADTPRFTNYAARMPARHPTPFSTPHPNGIPMAAYMDPMYVTRQQTPGLRPPMNPFIYPGMSSPINPFDKPRMRLPSMPLGENPLTQLSKDTDTANHKPTEKETKSSKENPAAAQKLPGINTITSALSQQKQILESQPPVNGFPSAAIPGYNPSSLSHDASKLPRPPQRSPIHMLPAAAAHNGQMFYRYYDPTYQASQPSPAMYLNHPNRPICPPFPGQYPPGFPFTGQVSPDVSPKRKRKKTSKSVIESHSAHLTSASAETTALGGDKYSKAVEKVGSSEHLGNTQDSTIKSSTQ